MSDIDLPSRLSRAGFPCDAHVLHVLSSSSSLGPTVPLVEALADWENKNSSNREGSAAWLRLSLEWDTFLASIEPSRAPPTWLDALPDFDGELITSGESLEKSAWDFGKVRRRRPAAVLRPANSQDVARAVTFCRRQRIPLSPRGFAHSAGAQMQVRDGLVLDMKSMNRVHELDDAFCDVEAGTGWDVVLKAAMSRGLTPPIVTDWLMVSVGGTISMGGFGFMSFWRGTQMDHLLELEVVTGAGEILRCSHEQNRALFDAVRGTHGKFGIITRARIPLEAAPDGVRLVQACYGNMRSMWHDLQRFSESQQTDLIHAFAAEKSVPSIATRMNSTDAMNVDLRAVEHVVQNVPGNWVFNLELVDFIGGPHVGRHPQVVPERLHCESGLSDAWEMDWQDFCFRVPPPGVGRRIQRFSPAPRIVCMGSDERCGSGCTGRYLSAYGSGSGCWTRTGFIFSDSNGADHSALFPVAQP